MIDEKNLKENFVNVYRHSDGSFRFQDITPKRTYHYALFSVRSQNYLLVSEKDIDGENLITLLPPSELKNDEGISKHSLSTEFHSFTHALLVSSPYHGYLKGRLDKLRDNLSWIIPIYNCEFSGTENKEDFFIITQKITEVLNWERHKTPKIRLYFDNPKTGAGNNPEGDLVSSNYLLSEIKNLNGISNGFLEITNYRNDAIELLSPEEGVYIVVRERILETEMPRDEAITQIFHFLAD
ncbi:hypothetical protein [Pseudomonas sp. NBRC 100443]|uniref:hypothetical protein n=1 Tax=Pseudomonas sp. NBRC 100443 TaxID=1113665 RepID=UPI0024A352AC|nr:hypothetical protein [Pseudomonas sp. NBRC 100443]GLU40014.1 hypothetical protein Pssp01_41070 [Pseudomonas sp. NBRC 100443]